MTSKTIFTKHEILNLDAETFSKLFYSKKVKAYVKDEHIIEGIVSEIGLAANWNTDSNCHLPVSIKIGYQSVFLNYIEQIELL